MNKQRFIARLGAFLIKGLMLTLRVHFKDLSGQSTLRGPAIWLFWHNRMLLVPVLYRRFAKGRHGYALTSASKDGEIIAGLMAAFGMGSVRGSTSKQGAAALRNLVRVLRNGDDIGITPDGPRGPIYTLGPGALLLAQLSGAPVIPIHVEYSRCIRFKSWDRFMVPLPFSRVDVAFGEQYMVAKANSETEFEAERLKLQNLLMEFPNLKGGRGSVRA